jgi:ankyrin repeat protein
MHTIENKKDRVLHHTGEWIFSDLAFHRWLRSGGSSVLWLHGDPGKGKTMLAIALVEELSKKLNANHSLAFFFCDNKDDRRRSAQNILRGVLYQIFTSRPELLVYFRTEYERQKEHLLRSPNTLFALWRILQNAVSFPHMERLYIVIDALDECDLESIDSLLSLLEPYVNSLDDKLQTTGSPPRYSPSEIKFIITSRNESAIKERLNDGLHISLEDNYRHVSHAVRSFVDSKVQQLKKSKRYNDDLAADVKQTLLDKAEGTFLWAALACRELSKPSVRLAMTQSVLKKLPSGIMPLYDRIVDQILNIDDEDMAHSTKMILRCMAAARRPLSLRELVVVASLPADYSDEIEILQDLVDGLCASMVDVRDGVLYFVHLSARDYIVSSSLIISDGLSSCHQHVVRSCFEHIRDADELSPESSETAMASYDRLEYPILFWIDHAKLCAEFSSQYLLENNSFFEENSRAFTEWFSAFWRKSHAEWEKRPGQFGLLHLAAYSNLAHLIQSFFVKNATASVNRTDSEENTPLIWAAKMGSLEAVGVLLDRSADVSVRNKNGVTALFLAASYGHNQVVKCLAERGASVHITDKLGWTPLHRAADQGDIKVVSLLLEHNANVEAKDDGTWTPLYRAVSGGHMDVVEILMKRNANPEVHDREGMTLLQTAAWNGHGKVVTLLLKQGAKIEARDREGWASLHHASWNGHATVVHLLLQQGADVNAKNNEGNTSLYHATWNGHLDVVRLLLQGKANVNETCTDGETALQQAAWMGHNAVATMLIEAGADLNIRSRSGRTALHEAATNGQQAMVDLLLHAGADPTLMTEDGQTAFEAAKENSYYDVARCLESRGGVVDGVNAEERVEPDGMDERRTGLDVDPAIADLLNMNPSLCKMQDHGDACSSEPFKITATVDGEERFYFAKISTNGEMFKGKYISRLLCGFFCITEYQKFNTIHRRACLLDSALQCRSVDMSSEYRTWEVG